MKFGSGSPSASLLPSKLDPKILMGCRYCEGGELFFFILKQKSLTEKDAAMIMKQSFSALKYLHENKISHRYELEECPSSFP